MPIECLKTLPWGSRGKFTCKILIIPFLKFYLVFCQTLPPTHTLKGLWINLVFRLSFQNLHQFLMTEWMNWNYLVKHPSDKTRFYCVFWHCSSQYYLRVPIFIFSKMETVLYVQRENAPEKVNSLVNLEKETVNTFRGKFCWCVKSATHWISPCLPGLGVAETGEEICICLERNFYLSLSNTKAVNKSESFVVMICCLSTVVY